MARGALIPVTVARLIDLFQPLQAPAIKGGALKGGIEQRRAPQREFGDVVTQFKRIIEQQQRPLNVAVRQQFPQVSAVAVVPQLQAEIRRFAPGGRRIFAAVECLSVRCDRQ